MTATTPMNEPTSDDVPEPVEPDDVDLDQPVPAPRTEFVTQSDDLDIDIDIDIDDEVEVGAEAVKIPDLDDDPDTSLVTSLCLHLVSEHHLADAVRMPDHELLVAHREQHTSHPQVHAIADHRFRPGVALHVMQQPCPCDGVEADAIPIHDSV